MNIVSQIAKRIIKPKDVISYFRYQTPLSKTEIKELNEQLSLMDKKELTVLLNTPKQELTKKELDLVMYVGTTFPEFGFPDKTMLQMTSTERQKLERNVNKAVQDMISGKDVEIVQAGTKVKNPDLFIGDSAGSITIKEGQEKLTPTKTKPKSLPEEEFYQTSFLFNEDIRNKKSGGGMLESDKDRYQFNEGTSYVDKIINGAIEDEINYASKYGDKYWNDRFAGKKGARLYYELEKRNRTSGSPYSQEDLVMRANKQFEEAGLPYRISDPREKKVGGGLLGSMAKKLIKPKSSGVKSATSEADAFILSEISNDANKLKQRGFSNERIQELIEEAYELGEPDDLIKALQEPIQDTKQKALSQKEVAQMLGYSSAGPAALIGFNEYLKNKKLRKAEGGRVQAAEGFPKKGSLLSDDMAML